MIINGYTIEPNVNLTGANLTSADLTRADLRRADLRRADLTRADLRRADLTRADLPYTSLADDRFYGLSYRWDGITLRFYAGCRSFTLDQAIAHWGGEDYPDHERGQRYVMTCQFLHSLNEAGLLLGGKG